MRKSILRLCALALFGVMSNMAFAEGDPVPANYLYQVNGDNTVKLVTVTNHEMATVATIPNDKITTENANIQGGTAGKEYTVTEIGDEAFASSRVLTEVNIPANVITIGSKAFNTPRKVTIYIDRNGESDNDLTIKSDAFRNQLSKTPEGVQDVTTIEGNKSNNNVVWFCNSESSESTVYNSMDLRKSAKIEAGAFAYTTIASTVVLPDYETIPEGMFMGTTSAEGGFCVKLPVGSKLKTVGKYAFAYSDVNSIGYTDPYGAANLLFLPAGFTTVEDYGFACCPLLDATKTVHSTGITERISTVGVYAFYGDDKFVSGDANFEDGFDVKGFENIFATFDVLAYGEGSFGKCNLTAINLSQSTKTQIPASAFADQKTAQVTNLVLPNGCVSVGDYAFANDNIATLNFPATLAEIGTGAFACKTEESAKLPTTLNLVGNYANKAYASSIPNHLSSALLSIGENAFDYRQFGDIYTHGYIKYNENKEPQYVFPHIGSHNVLGYNYIYLPAQADKTGTGLKAKMAEGGWADLKYPTTTGSVTYAGVNYTVGAQDAETGLYAVTVAADPFGAEDATIYAQFIGKEDANGYVPAFYFDGFGTFTTKTFDKNITFATGEVAPEQTYKLDPLASEKDWCDNTLDKDCPLTTELPANTFSGFTALKGVTFDSGFTKIGTSAFEGCTALEKVYATNVTAIGEKAFASDAALATFSDFSKVTTIGANAFENTTALVIDVEFPVLTYLGNYAFQNSGVKSVTATGEAGVTLCANVFTGCQNLATVNAPAFNNFAGSQVFMNCPMLATATIGAEVIPASTFNNSGNSVEAGLTVTANNATTINANAFTGSKVISFTGDKLATLDATAFQNCTDLKSFKVGEQFVTIPASAFKGAGAENFTVTAPKLAEIGNNAFENSKVVSVSDDEITKIGENAFKNSQIQTMELPKIQSIGQSAFYICNALKSFTTGSEATLTSIANATFSEAGAADGFAVSIPTVKALGSQAFAGSNLSEITLGALETLGDNSSAFEHCAKLSKFTANALTSIGKDALKGVGAEGGLTVEATSLVTIGQSAFMDSKLAAINAPAVTTINESAFSGTSLTKVSFPAVSSLGASAFNGCSLLKNVVLGSAELAAYTFNGAGIGSEETPTNLEVTTEATKINANAFNGSSVVTVNANKVTSLEAAAFSGCETLKTFNAAELTTILAGTFMNSSVEQVSIKKVTEIGDNAFNGSKLNSIEMPAVTKIGLNAFKGSALRELKKENVASLASIGSSAFANCTNLEVVTLPETLTFIPEYSFYNCQSLKSVELGSATITVKDFAFAETAIESIILPVTLTTILTNAFATESLETVEVSYTTVPALTYDAFALNDAGNYKAVLHVTGTAKREDYLNQANSNWKKFFIGNNIVINVNGTPIASDENGKFTLVDNEPTVEIPYDVTGNFEYVRNFASTAWQCWFVPFDIKADAVEGINFAMLYDTDNSDGATRIEYKEITDGSTIIKANVPYLVKPEAIGKYTFAVKALKATNTDKTAKVSNLKNVYTFTGTYTKKDGTNYETNPWYGLNAERGNFALAQGEKAYINAYRFYMTIADNTNPSDYVKFVVLDDEDATGISNINSNEIAEGAMFDLQGRKINAPVKGQVYIQNGVKKLAK